MLDLEYELKKFIELSKRKRSSCCGRKSLINRYKNVLAALEQEKGGEKYNEEELTKIEKLVKELAEQNGLN